MKYCTIVADPPWPIGAFPAHEHYRKRGISGKPVPYEIMSIAQISELPVANLSDGFAHLYLWTINDYLPEAFGVARAWGFEPQATLAWCKQPAGVGLGGVFASNLEFVLFCRQRSGRVMLAVTSALADAAATAGLTRRQIDAHMGTSDMAGWWLSKLEHRCAVPTWEQYVQLKQLLGLGDELDAEVWRLESLRRHESSKIDTRWFQWPRGKHSQKPEHFIDMVEQVSPGPYVELFSRRHRMGWDTWGMEAANTADFYPEASA